MPQPLPKNKRWDAPALEERTQAIAQELFAAAKEKHAHLSVLNRWTAQVLSWCLSDPSLKASLLRFIDVLPVLSDSRQIARHLREYFPQSVSLPAALRLGVRLSRPGLVTHGALAALIRQMVEQVGRQFIAERSPEAASRVIEVLAKQGATCTLDVLGEQVLSEAEADRYVSRCQALLAECAGAYARTPISALPTCGPRANLSLKPSALTPRFDPISPEQSVAQASKRILPLLQSASEHRALVHLDMEQYALRDLTVELAKRLLVHADIGPHAELGIVVQAYLRDAEAMTEELLEWLARHERALTVRLVKGAYWDSEIVRAQQNHWGVPVYEEKARTDAAFERLTQRLLEASPLVRVAIASHNVRSIAHAMAAAENLGLAPDEMEFQLLYGMGEAIQAAIVERGYPVRIYTPIGELIPGMGYLVRRLLENTSNESFLRQDRFEKSGADWLQPPAAAEESSVAGASQGLEPSSPSAEWQGEPLLDFSHAANRDRVAAALADFKKGSGALHPMLLGPEALKKERALIARNPAHPSLVIGRVTQAERSDVGAAVAFAAKAQPAWARTPARERKALMRRAAELIRREREALLALEVLEVGKTWREADADIVEAIEYLEYYAHQMDALEPGPPLLQAPGESNSYRYQPRGVAVVIAPWNFPAAILTGMASAALVSGSAVILKPAEQSSLMGVRLAQLFREAGVPSALVQCLSGIGEDVGDALVRHPDTSIVLFTGSKAVGLSIIEACARRHPGQRFIKRVVAEMGGKNAIIVDADADLDAAIIGSLQSAFGYGGQKCSAASRLILHESVYDRFLERFAASADRLVVGDPADPGVDMGPLIDESAQQRLIEAIERASSVGKIAYRYPPSRLPGEGHFVGPAIAVDVPPKDRLSTEELFGPLVCVFRASTFEEALALANDTDYALTGGVYSRSPSHLEEAIRRFDVGNLYLNRPITGARVGRQPFGGHRLSGLGTKAGGPDYLLQLLIPKTVCADTTRYGMPLD